MRAQKDFDDRDRIVVAVADGQPLEASRDWDAFAGDEATRVGDIAFGGDGLERAMRIRASDGTSDIRARPYSERPAPLQG
jgi:hypothetical protein